MEESIMIQTIGLTKEFINGKGIFDVNFDIKKGETFGYLGPNGAGKSTTIRILMGFLKPSRGVAKIAGYDCWSNSSLVQEKIGYLPGEIVFLEGTTGLAFLNLLGGIRGVKDLKRRNDLIDRLQFDVETPVKKMSKGMKQKLGIVAAFMHDPELLILDEPTSGLDPLMQRTFIDLILEEKTRGKTILMSSHIFQEIERTCDRVSIIKDGRIVSEEHIHSLQSVQRRIFNIYLDSEESARKLIQSGLKILDYKDNYIRIEAQGDFNRIIKEISKYDVKHFDLSELDLEEMFMHFYNKEETKN
jgi:ABC-2 type transport system ATP-binding protein